MTKVITEHFDYADSTLFHHTSEDVEPLLDSLKEVRNHSDPLAYKKNEANWRHVGTIPMTIIEAWLQESPPFNALGKDAAAEVLKRVERDYPYLMAVNKI